MEYSAWDCPRESPKLGTLKQMARCTLLSRIFTISYKNNIFLPENKEEGTLVDSEEDKWTRYLNVNGGGDPQEEESDREKKDKNGTRNIAKSTKNFRCDVCAYQTSRPSHLARHKRKHTGERPFECPICHRTFTRKDHCFSHQYLHHAAVILTCATCGKGFARKQYLLAHQTVHRNDVNTCGICGAQYKWRKSLKRHVKDKHTSWLVVCVRLHHLPTPERKQIPEHRQIPECKQIQCYLLVPLYNLVSCVKSYFLSWVMFHHPTWGGIWYSEHTQPLQARSQLKPHTSFPNYLMPRDVTPEELLCTSTGMVLPAGRSEEDVQQARFHLPVHTRTVARKTWWASYVRRYCTAALDSTVYLLWAW